LAQTVDGLHRIGTRTPFLTDDDRSGRIYWTRNPGREYPIPLVGLREGRP
jgi:hypothetical protein